MKIKILYLTAGLFFIVFMSCNSGTKKQTDEADTTQVAEKTEHRQHHESKWSYEGEKGPANWASLSDEYADCGGKMQSPIDIIAALQTPGLKALTLKYEEQISTKVINNGHSLQMNVVPGSTWLLDGLEFELLQFHFHCPSEHKVDGKAFPMEAHLVHAIDGKIAVIGLFFAEGAENAVLAKFMSSLPTHVDAENDVDVTYNPLNLLPADKSYYHYVGSLTTPPCTEGVQWYVMKKPIEASAEQIAKFSEIMPPNNARPVQPLNGRPIKEM